MAPHRKSGKRGEKEELYVRGVAGVRQGKYKSVAEASRQLGVSRTTLTRHLKGGKTRAQARERQQLLTAQEERALVDWISHAAGVGNPVPHSYIKEMAEEIRRTRVGQKLEFIRPMGGKWTRAFMKRFPQLKTKLSKAIEAARVTDVTREQVLNFNDEFRQVIHEKKIQLKNIYKSDETGNHSTPIGLTVGSSIGTCNGINVVVDIELNKQ